MQVELRNKYINQLYQTGKSRKYNLPQSIIKKFFMRIQQLEAAISIYDLWKTGSLDFKKLEGFENRYSLRIDKKWRLEMEIKWMDQQKTKGTIYIVEISKHYGD